MGDGVTDNSVAIAAAMTALNTPVASFYGTIVSGTGLLTLTSSCPTMQAALNLGGDALILVNGVPIGPTFYQLTPNSGTVGAIGSTYNLNSSVGTTYTNQPMTVVLGAELFVPAGVYSTGPFQLPVNAKIRGMGSRTSIFKLKSGAVAAAGQGASAGPWLAYTLNCEHLVIDGIGFDGNAANNATSRVFHVLATQVQDGPSLTLRDVLMTNAGSDSTGTGYGGASVYIGGTCWMVSENWRVDGCSGAIWHSTNDSVHFGFYMQTCGYPSGNGGLIIPPTSSNKWFGAYFGGNGNVVGADQIPQVVIYGATNQQFIGCTQDSAQGNGYLFLDCGSSYCQNNAIVGGLVSNPSQGLNNTYVGVSLSGHSTNNIISGVNFLNNLSVGGAEAINEGANAGQNIIDGCQFGGFAGVGVQGWPTKPIALNPGGGSVIKNCQGFGPLNGLGGSAPFSAIGTAVASATSVTPSQDLCHVTGTTPIATIVVGQFQQVTLIPDAVWTTTTGGNIAIASTAVVGKALTLTYDPSTSKWYPSY